MKDTQFYINGQWVDSIGGTALEVIDPSTEKVLTSITLGSQEDTDRAVDAASQAFTSWSHSTKAERMDLLKAILHEYEKRSDDMASTISSEMGAPISLSRESQTTAGSYHMEGFVSALETASFDEPLHPDSPDQRLLLEPVGVCALITPWNWPMNQIALKVIPAIATGCTTVLKPSELSPLSGMLFAQILHDSGVPAGVFNLINGDGEGVGTQLSRHRDVAMVSFTGSSRAGIAISKNAADTLKRVSLELGGKGANIVFADAGANAIKRGVMRCFNNTGQSCNAPTRMLVERSRYAEAVEQAKAQAENTGVSVASEPGTHIGPLVSKMQFDKVQSLIKHAMEVDGATLVAGGPGKPDGCETGYFARPTVFADCTNDMRIMREEVFGPVLSIMPFDTEEEAIAIANDTDYGLTNYIETEDTEKAQRVARQLRSGMVDINGRGRSAGSPFGGYKQSGNGREGGRWGLDEFLEVKAVGGWQ